MRRLLGLIQVTGQKDRTMLPLAIAMSVPLFAVIVYALLSDPHAPDAGPDHVSRRIAPRIPAAKRTRPTPILPRRDQVICLADPFDLNAAQCLRFSLHPLLGLGQRRTTTR